MAPEDNTAKGRVLFVDDEEDLRKVFKRVLSSAGYEVFVLSDGASVLKEIGTIRPDVILLDVAMPGMTGLEVCKRLKADPRTRNISIILFTAHGDVRIKVSGLDTGADDYLVKDADIEEVKARIRTQMRLKRAHDEVSRSYTMLKRANDRIKTELAMAKKVQQGIYPKEFPPTRGLEFAVALLPASELGGDYYDVFPVSDDETAFLIADVSGHDIASAFIVGMAKMSFSMHIRGQVSLVEVLNRVNADMLAAIRTSHHLTAFLAVFDARTRTLRYAKAGHFTQYLYRAGTRKVYALETEGMVIGALDNGRFQEKKCVLEPGDKIVMYTDGLIENMGPDGEPFGQEQLKRLIFHDGHNTAEIMHRRIMEAHQRFCRNAPSKDDRCLLIAGLQSATVHETVQYTTLGATTMPAFVRAADRGACRTLMNDIVEQLEENGFPGALTVHYQKLLQLAGLTYWSDPKSAEMTFSVSREVGRDSFKISLAVDGASNKKTGFFTTGPGKIIPLQFQKKYGELSVSETGDRLLFAYARPAEQALRPTGTSFETRDDGAYISVPPDPQQPISQETVKKQLLEMGVINADYALIRKALLAPPGDWIRIGPPFEYYNREKDAFFKLSVTPMKAVMRFEKEPDARRKPDKRDLRFILMRSGVNFGEDARAVDALLQAPVPGKQYVVAAGKAPVNGEDAVLREAVKIFPTQSPLKQDDGSVDYKVLDIISSVKKGDVILEKKPATPGIPGISVHGRTIEPRPGKDIEIKEGENTRISDDGCRLLATCDGFLEYDRHGLHVREVFYVKGDVNYATGNINYSGDVIVSGNVLSGFEIKADGDIWIKGCTEGARVVSTHGDIKLENGLLGKGKAEISAGGSIYAEFVQDALIRCRGDLVVNKSILHVRAEVTGHVKVEDPAAGSIIGSTVICRQSVEAAMVGSTQGARTVISLLTNHSAVLEKKLAGIRQLETETKNRIKAIESHIKTKRKILRSRKDSAPKSLEELEALVKSYYTARQHIEVIGERKANLEARLQETELYGKITITKNIYPNTVVCFNDVEMKILDLGGPGSFCLMGDEVHKMPMEDEPMPPELSPDLAVPRLRRGQAPPPAPDMNETGIA